MELDAETETRIVEKAEYIEDAVAVLSRKQSLSKATYLDSREQRAVVEREFQTALEGCIDIGELLLTFRSRRRRRCRRLPVSATCWHTPTATISTTNASTDTSSRTSTGFRRFSARCARYSPTNNPMFGPFYGGSASILAV